MVTHYSIRLFDIHQDARARHIDIALNRVGSQLDYWISTPIVRYDLLRAPQRQPLMHSGAHTNRSSTALHHTSRSLILRAKSLVEGLPRGFFA